MARIIKFQSSRNREIEKTIQSIADTVQLLNARMKQWQVGDIVVYNDNLHRIVDLTHTSAAIKMLTKERITIVPVMYLRRP